MEISPRQSDSPAYLSVPQGPFVVPESGGLNRVDIEVSLILPTFNEARNIRSMLELVLGALRAVEGLRFEILVVDDNSPDGTGQLSLEESIRHPEVRVMRRVEETGLATAVIRGWQAASGEILGVIDADLQHPPAVLPELVTA